MNFCLIHHFLAWGNLKIKRVFYFYTLVSNESAIIIVEECQDCLISWRLIYIMSNFSDLRLDNSNSKSVKVYKKTAINVHITQPLENWKTQNASTKSIITRFIAALMYNSLPLHLYFLIFRNTHNLSYIQYTGSGMQAIDNEKNKFSFKRTLLNKNNAAVVMTIAVMNFLSLSTPMIIGFHPLLMPRCFLIS